MSYKFDWEDVEAFENEQDYKYGYEAGLAGKPVYRWDTDAYRDGHSDGTDEREFRRERAREERKAAARARRLTATVAPRRPGISHVTTTAPILRKRNL